MKRKWVYKLKAIFTPLCWFRSYKTHKVFDEWLWEKLNSCDVKFLDEWTAKTDDKVVWVRNAPYANGFIYVNGFWWYSCSRATAILLEERLRDSYFH